jgi:hypothetical protein
MLLLYEQTLPPQPMGESVFVNLLKMPVPEMLVQ